MVVGMKLVFMGTPDFAAGALRALIAAGHEIAAVVTQPDKAKGRSREPVPSPVKVCALEHDIPVLQPERVKAPEAVEALKAHPADIYIVAAYGQILSQEILDIPKHGCLNIHASLLPKYRGASPIQHVIIDGEERTGVTVMQMDAGLDTGDMLYKKETAIGPEDTYETLHDRLMELGGEAITEALSLLEQGKLTPEKQDDSQSCYAPLIGKSMGEIDFSKTAAEIDRLIRGMTPWPSAYTYLRGRQLKVWKAVPDGERDVSGHKPGEILSVDKESLTVATGRGTLQLLELQMEGKKRMSAHDFLLGVKPEQGEILGTAGRPEAADIPAAVHTGRP
ncbi:MAG: methionyl-tRNA formyltransferase [Firmicutes bacterium]|nr:methionyl-tRNA formyltransferase [Bacillota bacterium]